MSDEKITKKSEHDIVPAIYYDMFSYRLMGFSYQQIAAKTGYSYVHVRRLFSGTGALADLWQKWVRTAKEENIEEAINIMFGHLPDIVRARVIHAKQMNMGGVLSSKMVFDHTLGSPEQRMKLDARVGVFTFTDWIKQQTLMEKENESNKSNKQKDIPERADPVSESGVA